MKNSDDTCKNGKLNNNTYLLDSLYSSIVASLFLQILISQPFCSQGSPSICTGQLLWSFSYRKMKQGQRIIVLGECFLTVISLACPRKIGLLNPICN